MAAHSAYEMFSWYKYLIVSLVFSHLGFWSGSLFLIAHFPDLCLLVLFCPYAQNRMCCILSAVFFTANGFLISDNIYTYIKVDSHMTKINFCVQVFGQNKLASTIVF